jgi:hypothetical protein
MAHSSDGVEMKLTREAEVNRLDFDFQGHGGCAIARPRLIWTSRRITSSSFASAARDATRAWRLDPSGSRDANRA